MQVIPASVGNSIRMVPVAEVLAFEAADKYVRVLTASREYLIRTPIMELAAQLDPAQFWQIHRNTLVNTHAIATTLNAFIETREGWEDALSHQKQDSEILEKWQTVWDKTYVTESSTAEVDLDLNGWISSYTGKPIPEHEMKAWVDETVHNILSLNPQNVIEIGCGSGLLLLRVAPKVKSYTGIDFSRSVLSLLEARIQKLGITNTKFICRNANQFIPKDEKSVDTVIINSVSQYFPNIEHLQVNGQPFEYLHEVQNQEVVHV